MDAREIYLDNSATTMPHPEVVEVVAETMRELYGNPSSLHRKGAEAARVVLRARETVASVIGVSPGELIFTSGGTESNNLAIRGAVAALRRRGRHIITTAVEHPSVLEVCRVLAEEGFEVTYLPVDEYGILKLEELEAALRDDTILVSTMHVNNETGAVQPLEEVARVLARRRARAGYRPVWHVDAVQAFGKVPVRPRELGIDLLSLSAHKVHGPKGVGALYVASGLNLKPLLAGGGQEGGFRSGTENVPGIAGFGEAARLAKKQGADLGRKLSVLKRRLVERVLREIPGTRLNGPPPDDEFGRSAPHIVSISFAGVRGEVLVHALEASGIYVSTGAACSSRKQTSNYVLEAMGVRSPYLEGNLRFSFSGYNDVDQVDFVVERLKAAVDELRTLSGGNGGW